MNDAGCSLRDCIEGVPARDDRSREPILVDNCSSDDMLTIANWYAMRDTPILVPTNERQLAMAQYFSRAFGTVPRTSKSFEVVCADDGILPACAGKPVARVETPPTVGPARCRQHGGAMARRGEPPECGPRLLRPGEVAARRQEVFDDHDRSPGRVPRNSRWRRFCGFRRIAVAAALVALSRLNSPVRAAREGRQVVGKRLWL